jgi:hypothetical protein
MRKHAVVFVDVERDQSTDGGGAVQRVEKEPLMFQDLLSELRVSEVRNIQRDHDRRRRAKPPTRRRARDSEVGGDGHVPGALDEIPKAVVVALLRSTEPLGHPAEAIVEIRSRGY